MKRLLFTLLALAAPPGQAEHWLGDLEEESATRQPSWLIRHTLAALFHALRVRATHAGLLEQTAAAAFLVGIPLIVTLELRRFALTQIPFRESAGYSVASLTALAAIAAALAFWQSWLLGRRWPAVAAATLLILIITALIQAPWLILTAAVLTGGSLATLTRRGGSV